MKFNDGNVTELTANVIDGRMYAQCDEYWNDTLMLDLFIYHRKTERALSLQDKKLTVNEKTCIKKLTAGW